MAAKEMQSAKLRAILLVLVVSVGLFSLPLAISSLMNYVIIESRGRISFEGPVVTANSGSARDIQAAVDQVAAGGGIVYVPEGEWNFVEAGKPWQTVDIPAGVNVFGAPSVRNENNQVTEWKTILKMPYDVGDGNVWFRITGDSDPSEPTRFSDIKIVGYRSIDRTSTTKHTGIEVMDVLDFRIDHVCLEHTAGCGILIWGLYCCGVIDHCRIYNIYGFDDLADYTRSTIIYGVELHRGFWSEGYDPTMEVLGKYTDYTVFIEDCYFSRWRHCVSSGHGAHYVFRYNVIDDDFGHFSLDVHGLRDSGSDRWGSRAAEFYENTLINVIEGDFECILQNGGGSGVWFNNYIDSSYRSDGFVLYDEDYITSSTWHLKDFYCWSSKGSWACDWDGIPDGFTAARHVLADWDRPAYDRTNPSYPNIDPSWSIAGYKPYAYPHPLTLET